MNQGQTLHSCGIIGVGKALPSKIVTNHDIVAMGLDTSDEWITERTGIKERRVTDPETSSVDLAVEACQQALENAQLSVDDIGGIVVATTSPDNPMFPSSAALVHHRLGMKPSFAFDVSAACTGFNYALSVGSQFVQTGQAKHVLVVAVDCLTKFLDWTDRTICALFGDGSGAVVLGQVPSGYGILTTDLFADGKFGDILQVKAGGSKYPLTKERLLNKEHLIYMNGRAVFKTAVSKLVTGIRQVLKKYDYSVQDIDTFVFHQANIRIIEFVQEKLGITSDQIFTNIHKYGNTSSASIPIALEEVSASLKPGALVMLIGFGAGFTWGINIVKWSEQHDR